MGIPTADGPIYILPFARNCSMAGIFDSKTDVQFWKSGEDLRPITWTNNPQKCETMGASRPHLGRGNHTIGIPVTLLREHQRVNSKVLGGPNANASLMQIGPISSISMFLCHTCCTAIQW
jgi:hypothetical protein